jgi:hypothetical protein
MNDPNAIPITSPLDNNNAYVYVELHVELVIFCAKPGGG